MDRCLHAFLDALPLTEDLEQAAPTHELLMEFVNEGHPFFKEHVAKVCKVFVDVYGRDTSSDALNEGIRKVLSQAGEERLRQMKAAFTEKQKKRITKILRDARQKQP